MAAALALIGVLSAGAVQDQLQQYLVVASGNDFPESRVQAVQQAGGQVIKVFPQIGVAVVTSGDPAFPTKAKAITGIQSVAPDRVAYPVEEPMPAELASGGGNPVPNNPDLRNLQWGLEAVKAPAAWALGYTGKGVRVAVIDTGVMTRHPDLVRNLNLNLSKSVVPGETVEFIPMRDTGSHATMVAGIIAAADDGIGITGVAPDAEVVVIKVISDRVLLTQVSWIVEAILYAADIHADLANLSLGFWWMKRSQDPYWWQESDVAYCVAARAANYAQQRGTLLVASAGNDALNFDGWGTWVQFPRDLPGAIGVAATTPKDCWACDPTVNLDWPAPYTSYGQRVIDLAAPGGNLDFDLPSQPATLAGVTQPAFVFNMVISSSTSFGPAGDFEKKGTWNFACGTSMAAPHVCGVAALAIEAHGGSLTPAQLKAVLQQSADDLGKPGNDDFYGAGRVNALRAVLQK